MNEAVGWALLFVAVAAVGPGSAAYAVIGDQVSTSVIVSLRMAMLNLWNRTHKKSREPQLDWQDGPFHLERPLFIFHALTVDPICRRSEWEAFFSREYPGVRAIDPPISMPVYAQETYRRIAARRNWRKNHRCPVAETQCFTRLQLIGID